MTDSEDIKYLKQDKIGKVIAKGLAAVYESKPQKPITYFANWLLNYSQNLKKIDTLKQEQEQKKVKLSEHEQLEAIKQKQSQKQRKAQQKLQQEHLSFQDKIKNEKYHMELLITQLPEFLEKSLGVTGVYIGQLNFPSKPLTDQDVDQTAHLVTDGVKLIKYIGSSISHQQLMIGKTLALDKGVTAEVFTTPAATTDESGNQVIPEKAKFIYIPDVVQNSKIHYFKIPKLGSYIALPLVYKSYLSESTFDTLLTETKKQAQQRQIFENDKATHLEQYRTDLQELKTKLQTFIDKQDEAQIQTTSNEIKQLQTKLEQQQTRQFQYISPQILSQTKQFVVCSDTLGQDRQITNQQKQFFLKYVDLFRDEWQKCELNLVTQDVQYQINYQKGLKVPLKEYLQQLTQDLQNIPQQVENQIQEKYKDNQKLLSFETEAAKLELLKKQFQKEEVIQYITRITTFRVLKFPKLIQNLLYLLGYKKQDINIPETTHLNWKYVKKQLIDEKFIKQILNYEFRGPKHQQFNIYEKVDNLLAAFSKFSEEHVFEYNIGLGLLLKFVLLALKLRKQDVQIRRAAIEQQKKKRQQKQQQNDKIQKEKQQALEKHKATIPPEELEAFNEQQWRIAYEQEHPLVDIPPQVKQDIDNDI